jgi:hypothetical protein
LPLPDTELAFVAAPLLLPLVALCVFAPEPPVPPALEPV